MFLYNLNYYRSHLELFMHFLKKKILTIKIKVVCCGKAGAVGKIIV